MEHHVHLDNYQACRMCVERENEVERLRGELERVKLERDGFDAIAQYNEDENERLLKHLYDEHGCSDPPLAIPGQSRPPQT